MPGEGYLEPVVTKLEGDISNLAKTLAEAKAMIKGFGTETERQTHDDGAKAGKSGGEAMMGEYQKALTKSKKDWKDYGDFVNGILQINQKRVRDLATELQKTGDIDVWKKLQDAQKGLKMVEEVAKDLKTGVSTGLTEGAKEGSAGLQGILSNAITGAPVIAALVGLGITLSPLLGAIIGGGILAGVAGVGIGAAIAGQMDSPLVKGAWARFTATGKTMLSQATQPFEAVFVGGLNRFSNDFSRWEQPLANALEHLAPYVDKLVIGVEGFLQNAWPGFDDALNAGEIVLEGIAQTLPEVGTDFARMFRSIADGAPGARDGMITLLHIIGWTAEATGVLVEGLSKGYTILEGFGQFLTGDWAGARATWTELIQNTHSAGDENNKLITIFHNLGGSASDAASQIDKVTKALDDLTAKNLTADEMATRQKQSIYDLSNAIAQNGVHWDDNSEAALRNQAALQQAIHTAERKRDSDIKGGKDALTAAEDYNTQVDALLKLAGQAGATTADLNAMKGRYEIDIDTIYRTVKTTLTAEQFAANPSGLAGGGFAGPDGIVAAAQGLLAPRSPGTLVLAGEGQTGGEWMIPRRGITQQRAATLLAGAAADHGLGMGGDGAYLQLVVPLMVDGRKLAEATYEGFVNFGQERKNRRGSTGF